MQSYLAPNNDCVLCIYQIDSCDMTAFLCFIKGSYSLSTSALPTIWIIFTITNIHVLRLSLLCCSYTLSGHPQKVVTSIVVEVMKEVVEPAYISKSTLVGII